MISIPERLKEEVEMFRKMLDQFSCGLRVAAPGIIKSFDANKQTAVVQIAITEKINNNGNMENVAISVLLDVPVCLPRAGNLVLTMPITVGDECMVIFMDNCYDAWWQSGGVQNQIDKRRHDLSDAILIPGPWSQPNKLTGYSTTAAELRNEAGTTKVSVENTKIVIKAGTVEIGEGTLRKLITEQIASAWADTHTHLSAAPGAPTGAPVVSLTSQLANCTTTKAKAEGL